MQIERYTFYTDIKKDTVRFLFISKGTRTIVKIVQYERLNSDEEIYNLGFGDLEPLRGHVDDAVNSNNTDVYKVFNTVLHSVSAFFELLPKATVFIAGSDSSTDFELVCKSECLTPLCCSYSCRKVHQRIKAYSHYLNKNYLTLTNEYDFFGRPLTETGFTVYNPSEEYSAPLVKKKI